MKPFFQSFERLLSYIVGLALLLLAFARASDLWQELPGVGGLILTIIIVAWWYVRGRLFSRALTTVCAIWLICEAFYLYGQAGPGLAIIGALCWFSKCRPWQENENRFRRALAIFLVVGAVVGTLVALKVLNLDGGHRFDILIGTLSASGIARAIILGATRGAVSSAVFVVALIGYLLSNQVQAHEYFYFFFGPPQYLVHPTFGPMGVWVMGFSALALLGISRRYGGMLSLLALIASALAVYYFPPPFASPWNWAASLASPIALAGLGLLVGVIFHVRHSETREQPLPTARLEEIAIWCGRGAVIIVVIMMAIAAVQSFILIKAGPKLVADKGTPCLMTKQAIVQTVIAEDILFFAHRGVDFARFKWIVRDLARTGEFGRGASTISMQLAKLEYQDDERTLLRKLRQIFLGLYLDATNSKAEILRRYLALAPFAPGVRGICAASQYFYSQSMLSLTPAQSLALIMTIQDPSAWNPKSKGDSRVIRKRARVITSRVRSYGSRYDSSVNQIDWAK